MVRNSKRRLGTLLVAALYVVSAGPVSATFWEASAMDQPIQLITPPSITLFFCLVNRRNTSPNFFLICPKIAFFRSLGMNTM